MPRHAGYAPEVHPSPPPWCCVKCKTPYMCGNPACPCHVKNVLIDRKSAHADGHH